jgi:uncharacterized protein (UPF0332 family)
MPPAPPALYVAKVEEFLHAAALDLADGLAGRTVSNVYYAVFHAASGLLASVGLSVQTHRGTQQLLSLHFVLPGHLPAGTGSIVGKLAADRGFADYAVAADITLAAAMQAVRDAATVLRPMLTLLEQRTGPAPAYALATARLAGLEALAASSAQTDE